MTGTQHCSLLHVTKCSHLAHLQSRCEYNAASVCLLCESSVLGTDPVGWPWLRWAPTLDNGPGWMQERLGGATAI